MYIHTRKDYIFKHLSFSESIFRINSAEPSLERNVCWGRHDNIDLVPEKLVLDTVIFRLFIMLQKAGVNFCKFGAYKLIFFFQFPNITNSGC